MKLVSRALPRFRRGARVGVKSHLPLQTSVGQEESAKVAHMLAEGGGGRGALIGEVCGLSTAPQGGSSGSSVKNKAARILADAPEAISPRLRRSFVDMQYSPSTGMD
jgi:hypothetical protein